MIFFLSAISIASWSLVGLERNGSVPASILLALAIIMGASAALRLRNGFLPDTPRIPCGDVAFAVVVIEDDIDLSRRPVVSRGRVTRFSTPDGRSVRDDLEVTVWLKGGGEFLEELLSGTTVATPARLDLRSDGGFNLTGTGTFQVLDEGYGVRLRHRFFLAVTRRMRRAPEEISSLAEALLLGRRRDLGVLFQERFRRSGAMHILALSGMHLAILALLFQTILETVLSKGLSGIVTATVLLAYTWIVGPLPSLLRADLAYLLTLAMQFRNPGLNAFDRLVLVIPLAQVVCPGQVEEVGFILSLSSLSGIVLFSETWSRIFSRWLPVVVSRALGASIGAFLVSAPLSLYYFGSVYPVGILASAPLALLTTLFMWNLLLLLLLVPVPVVGTLLIRLSELFFRLLEGITVAASRVPGLRCGVSTECVPATVLVVVGIAIGIVWRWRLAQWNIEDEYPFDSGSKISTRSIRTGTQKTVGSELPR